MPTIAETYDALRQRVQAILDAQPGESMYQKCWALRAPLHASTIQRFLFGMPMRTETLTRLEQWVQRQEAHPGAPPTAP